MNLIMRQFINIRHLDRIVEVCDAVNRVIVAHELVMLQKDDAERGGGDEAKTQAYLIVLFAIRSRLCQMIPRNGR